MGRGHLLSLDLKELLEGRVLVGDGAMGTLLGERGVGFGHPYARANLSHPDMVAGIHEEYLRAGASVIETNTFSANRFKLETHDLEERVREVNAAGARLARTAVEDAGSATAVVLGAIGPLGRPLAPIGPVRAEEAREVFLEQAEAGARLIGGCCGTTPAHVHALSEALRDFRVDGRTIRRQATVARKKER